MAEFAGLNASQVQAVGSTLGQPASNFQNNEEVEIQWAMKAYRHAEIYFNLLCSVAEPKNLKLTKIDDVIYQMFRETFPDMNIAVVDVEAMKAPAAKEKWRPFCEEFRDRVEDYNFGTLVRVNADDEYTEKNTEIVPRVQFFALEIARNREGCNDGLREKYAVKDDKPPCLPEKDDQMDLKYFPVLNTIGQLVEKQYKE
ncbi:protein PBDC1 [Lingula anatina]|uniref:Protein PBDC1 n=1 Tax=Lingula anatina TaxID=7574 RepID=A0A1S3H6B0_LINAN|nr:protein PBDC1 [Lingula anatina]|eukprot:XP_013381016.1 protein PBDC1 [Lingula anatina]